MNIAQLDDGMRPSLVAHFLELRGKDLALRFGTPLPPRSIAAYVDRIDFGRDAVFGTHDEERVLTGVAHVAYVDDFAEVGLSVLPAHRSRGLGRAMFERAVAHARTRSIPRLLMHFLWGNLPIMRIARRFRMHIVANAGEARAELDLPPRSFPMSPIHVQGAIPC